MKRYLGNEICMVLMEEKPQKLLPSPKNALMAHLYLLEETKCFCSVYSNGRDIKCTGHVEEAMVKDAAVDTSRSGYESQDTYEPERYLEMAKGLPGRLDHTCMKSHLRTIHKRERYNGVAAIGWAFIRSSLESFPWTCHALEVAETFQQRPQLMRAKQIQRRGDTIPTIEGLINVSNVKDIVHKDDLLISSSGTQWVQLAQWQMVRRQMGMESRPTNMETIYCLNRGRSASSSSAPASQGLQPPSCSKKNSRMHRFSSRFMRKTKMFAGRGSRTDILGKW